MTLKESERLQLTDWMHDALALLVQRGAELTHGEMRIRFGLEAVLPKVEPHAHGGVPKTKKERAKLHAARERQRGATG